MRRRASTLIAACLGILAAGTVHAQARNTPARKATVRVDPVVEHAAKLAKIDSWLRSLVGRYRLSVDGSSQEGIVDCSGVGTGPGVHCIFSIGPPRQRDRWENAVMLFGIDNEGPGVHRFQINRDSTAEMSVSPLRGDAVTFHVGECPVIQHYPPVVSINGVTTFSVLFCRRETRVLVQPDGRFVRIRLSTVEQVLVRPPGGGGKIMEFRSLVNWTLERTPAPRGTSR